MSTRWVMLYRPEVSVDPASVGVGEHVAFDVLWPVGFSSNPSVPWPGGCEAFRAQAAADTGGWPIGGALRLQQRVSVDPADLGHVIDGIGVTIGRVISVDPDGGLTLDATP